MTGGKGNDMGHQKDLLLHLYGEKKDAAELRRLLEDEQLREEHAVLSEVKFRLDHRTRVRPDPDRIDQIVAEAGRAFRTGGKRVDRPPLLRIRPLKRLLLPALSVAAAAVVTVGIGFLARGGFDTEDSGPGLAHSGVSTAPPESLLRATPVPPGLVQSGTGLRDDAVLAWDGDEQLRDIYRRIRRMRPSTDLDWGEPVPLESLNGLPRRPGTGLKQVGAPK